MELGLGHLGLTPSVFYAMNFREFFAALDGMQEMERTKARRTWEQTRWLATCLLQPHLGKGKKLNPSDLMQFAWEKDEQPNSLQTFEMLAKGSGTA